MKLTTAVVTCTAIVACSDYDVSTPPLNSGTPSAGDADFSNFVSIGDSLTAGYADGTLYLLGQQHSYPNTLAQQFAAVGGGAFAQPETNDNIGGLLFNDVPDPDFGPRLVLNTETEMPEQLAGTPTTDALSFELNGMTFNNMGIPAMRSFHMFAYGYGDPTGLLDTPPTANPYYVRFAVSPDASSRVLDDIVTQAPSFITLWLGSNDVIWYGFEGGTGNPACDPNISCQQNDITDPDQFAAALTAMLAGITGSNPGMQGVLMNVPDVTTIPYFTVVPYNPVPLDQATADILNAAYTAYNAGLDAALAGNFPGLTQEEVDRRKISFTSGQNAVVILDEGLTDLTSINAALVNMRQATAEDLIPLEKSQIIGTLANPSDPNSAWGVGVPLQDEHVLIPSEIQAMVDAVNAYNDAIEAAADADPNMVLLDVNKLFADLMASGIDYGTGAVTADFATGGFFSLDGIHPTGRGYAIIANSLIDTINSSFNANVFKVDPGAYPTVFLK
jgi:lysophospholipase L1-like esterase